MASDITWTTEMRRLGDLKEWVNNPRQLSKHDAEHIAKSLAKFGLADPLIINLDNSLIGGHQRKHLIADPEALIDCRVPSRLLTEKEAEELAIRLNKNAGNWDWDKLANGFEMDNLIDWGFSQEELYGLEFGDAAEPPNDPGANLDQAEELLRKWGVHPGDLWALGEHHLLCADSQDHQAVLRLMDGQQSDLVATDPPYGVEYVGKTADALTIQNDERIDLLGLLMGSLGLAKKVSRPGAVWYVAGPAGQQSNIFATVLQELGIWRQTLCWVKDSMVLGHSDYHYQHELIFYGWTPGGPHRQPPDRTQVSVWQFDRPKASRQHPTMKPIELYEKAISNSSAPGEIVYEPFSGSGTTILACERLGRKCRAIEIEPKYVAVALERWSVATGRQPILEDGA